MTLDLGSALSALTVATLKDLIRYLPGVDSVGRKEQLLERILVAMQEPGLTAVWSRLDKTQQAAVAEAVHGPQGEYSPQRFFAKYQCAPAHTTGDAESDKYSSAKSSAKAALKTR